MTRLVLVRHGQTAWNRVERFRGQADVPLDDVGVAQAAVTGAYIAATWKPAAVYASPLSRAMDTAAAIAAPLGLCVLPHPGLLDITYGEWQGLTPEEVAQRWPVELDRWYSLPEQAHIPGGEVLGTLRARGMAAVTEVVDLYPKETVVLVGHTVINRVLLTAMLGMDLNGFWRLGQDPCAINVILAEERRFTLCLLNQTLHLRKLV